MTETQQTDAPCTDCGVRSEAGDCLCGPAPDEITVRLDRLERACLPTRPRPHYLLTSLLPVETWRDPSEAGIHICQSCGTWRGFEDGPYSSLGGKHYCDRCLHVAQRIVIESLVADVEDLKRQVGKLRKKAAKR